MYKQSTNYLIFLFLFVFAFSSPADAQKGDKMNTLTKKEVKEGWELLFNGKDMNNWEKFKGGEVTGWKIVNGELYNSGKGSDHGGDIITKKEFENFELTLEWRIDPQSNSGIFYHVQTGLTDAIYQSGPEYQLLDDKGWPTPLKAYQYTGSNYAMKAPHDVKLAPVGKWNKTRIVVRNPHVEHWLNGKKVVEYDLWTDEWKAEKAAGKWKDAPYYGISPKGHIGLQDHGGLTVFRNMKIRELK